MVRVALTAVLVAMVLLAVPLALAIRFSLYADQRDALERAALAGAVRVSPDYATGDPVELPPPPDGGRLGLYDPQLRLRAGSGPRIGDDTARRALTGTVTRSTGAVNSSPPSPSPTTSRSSASSASPPPSRTCVTASSSAGRSCSAWPCWR
ncbi:hypothetical protein SAV31267_098500 [Streptomyces avermitilis]|uniref:Uncharacterized protein n=1 Tax=Streptomyces avermitilis TaxID=33903 RepID=A0A4D4NA74_STRAX|nr:hypothetical protein SAV31267_098500 [Streptomyces avermitilis]